MTNFDDVIMEAIKLVLAGIVGGLIGARANDKLTRRRESESGIEERRRNFLAFMAQLRAESERNFYPPGVFFDFYTKKIPNFKHSVALIVNDIPAGKCKSFEKLVRSVTAYDNSKDEQYNRGKFLESIDAILCFFNSN